VSGSRHVRPSDLRGFARLAVEATAGLTDLVEALHGTIAAGPLTGFVYGSVRGVTRLVGGGLDAVLGRLEALLGDQGTSPQREVVLSALNGVVGDYLAATSNPLAIPMTLRERGPRGGRRIAVFLHGLCMSDLQWAPSWNALGYTPLYLRYNTGLPIAENGEACADLLETVIAGWPGPVDELVLVGHSMGGLVARSAQHHAAGAGRRWSSRLSAMVFLGTPHQGAPLERLASWLGVLLGAVPYSAPFERLARIRSAGITDLRHGNVVGDARRAVPLPAGVRCFAVAARRDGLVPVASALGLHPDADRALRLPESHRWIAEDMDHLDLLHRPEVQERVRRWLSPE